MPKRYIWDVQEAERRNKKERAMGGMVMGRREKIEIERSREERVEKKDGILIGKLCLGREWWRLVEVYVNKDLEEKMEKLRKWIEDREEGVRVLIGGDFNARKGKIGGE